MGELDEHEMKKLREMIESWDSAQTGIQVFRVIGDMIKWLAAVLAAVALLWAAFNHRTP